MGSTTDAADTPGTCVRRPAIHNSQPSAASVTITPFRFARIDIVSSEFWYEGPAYKPHRFREIEYANNYVDNFSDLAADFDGDGHTDIVSCAWFGKSLTFWKNPGKVAKGMWKPQFLQEGFNVEFCFLVDLNNDGKALEIRTGVNRKRQCNLYDPDGTRIELMEPFTIDRKPTPSATAAAPPMP